jgi:hypothetical protein
MNYSAPTMSLSVPASLRFIGNINVALLMACAYSDAMASIKMDSMTDEENP